MLRRCGWDSTRLGHGGGARRGATRSGAGGLGLADPLSHRLAGRAGGLRSAARAERAVAAQGGELTAGRDRAPPWTVAAEARGVVGLQRRQLLPDVRLHRELVADRRSR